MLILDCNINLSQDRPPIFVPHGFTIVTQDSDFNERSLVYGYPPKVIWLRTENTSTQNIKQLMKKHSQDIILFEKDKILGCLQIY